MALIVKSGRSVFWGKLGFNSLVVMCVIDSCPALQIFILYICVHMCTIAVFYRFYLLI